MKPNESKKAEFDLEKWSYDLIHGSPNTGNELFQPEHMVEVIRLAFTKAKELYEQQIAELKQEIRSEVLDEVSKIFEHGFYYPNASVQMSYKEVREEILELSKKGGQDGN